LSPGVKSGPPESTRKKQTERSNQKGKAKAKGKVDNDARLKLPSESGKEKKELGGSRVRRRQEAHLIRKTVRTKSPLEQDPSSSDPDAGQVLTSQERPKKQQVQNAGDSRPTKYNYTG